jgi:cytochrome c553
MGTRLFQSVGVFAGFLLGGAGAASAANPVDPAAIPADLAWAYPTGVKGPLPQVPPGVYHVSGSDRSYSAEQVNGFEPIDWYPASHPPMPAIVAHGVKDGPDACAECHLVNGQGFIGVPNLSGLPAAYIEEQVREFRSGRRQSAVKNRPNTALMVWEAAHVSDEDVAAAAKYYSSLLPVKGWYRVIETDQVPATTGDYYGWVDPVAGGGTEPLGHRIVELPLDWVRYLVGDATATMAVYVPKGSLARGAKLAVRPAANGQSCVVCHGADGRGTAVAPPLAGRAASVLARALWEIKVGTRTGPAVALMVPAVAPLSPAEITDLAAYLSSLPAEAKEGQGRPGQASIGPR